MPRAHTLNNWQRFRRVHHTFPSTFGYYKQVNEINKTLNKSSSRFIADISTTENLAWVTDTRSFTGYEGKPIFKEMSKITLMFYSNWPYEMWAYLIPKYLLSNMNVEYYLNYYNSTGENAINEYKDTNNNLYYSTRPLNFIDELNHTTSRDEKERKGSYQKYFKEPNFKIHTLDKPMPYLYFQNKLYYANVNEQYNKLLYTDLKRGAFISNSYLIPLEVQQEQPIEKSGNTTEDFEKLQNGKNQIIDIDMKRNNKLTLKVKIENPTMLVRNEAFHPGWKVYIDNKEDKILPINYIQQGVFLKKGEYQITFKFFPKALYMGLIVSLIFLIILIIILAFIYFNYLSNKKKK
jgi:hypothetical protein